MELHISFFFFLFQPTSSMSSTLNGTLARSFQTQGARCRSSGFFVRMATPNKIPRNLKDAMLSSESRLGFNMYLSEKDYYSKCPKISNTLFHTFFNYSLLYIYPLFLKMLSGMANSVVPDQTAPSETVWLPL